MPSIKSVNWQTLERLRQVFLARDHDRSVRSASFGPPGPPLADADPCGLKSALRGRTPPSDYWQSAADLADYDATFAQRIGWKWDHVLGELQARGWQPPGGVLLDWGCGSGVAARAFLDWFGPASAERVAFWDRSSLAVDFAVGRARDKYAGLPVSGGLPERASLVLVSHVLTELDDAGIGPLLDQVARATAVIWIEPGTWDSSRRLIGVRERLRRQFHLVAPCTHGGGCGLLAPGNDRHWCHHFGSPPPGVFGDAFWGRFAQMIGVDLRSLPLSYLVLDRRPTPPLPVGTVRILGRPRVYKTHAAVQACAEEGVGEVEVRRRQLPEVVARFRAGKWSSLQQWTSEGTRAVAVTDLLPVRVSS